MNVSKFSSSIFLAFVFVPALAVAQNDPVSADEVAQAELSEEKKADGAASSGSSAVEVEREVKIDVGFSELLNRPGGLTSEEAASAAARYSLDARIAEQDLKSAEAQITKTKYNYAPRVTLTASYTRNSSPDVADTFGGSNLVGTTDPEGPLAAGAPLFAIDGSAFTFGSLPNNYYLNAGMVIPISDYLLNMSQAFAGVNAAKRTAELNRKAAMLNASANARLLYYEWALGKLRAAEAERTIKRAQAQLDDLKQLNQAGQVARADVLRQDAFLARTELDLRRARVRADIAHQNLHSIMTGGEGTLPAWQIGEDVLKEQPGDNLAAQNIEALQNEAIANRLEIQALENTVYALKQKSSVERSQGYPRLEGFGNLTYANPNPVYYPPANQWNASWDLGIRLVWTVNDLGAASAEARSTDADSAKIRAQRQQLADQLRTEVLTAMSTMEEAYLAQDSANRGLAAAQAAYDDRLQLFQHGRATSLDVLESESALLRARLDLIESYVSMRTARVRFEHALGRDAKK